MEQALICNKTVKMSRLNPVFEIISHGIYAGWDKQSKDLPKLLRITTTIPLQLNIEFGYVLHIRKGKGIKLTFVIEHPDFKNSEGRPEPPFTGEHYVNSNDWKFFLGDSVWEPIEDKVGDWRLKTYYNERLIADKTFRVE